MRAYLSGLTARAGQTLTLHATGLNGATATVREYLHSDPHPDGPGVVTRDCNWGRAALSAPTVPASLGSHLLAPDALPIGGDFTFSVWIWPTDLSQDNVLCSWSGQGGEWSLQLVGARLALVGGGVIQTLDYRLRERSWIFAGIASGAARMLRPPGAALFASVWGRTGGPFAVDAGEPTLAPDSPALTVGALADGVGRFDGRIAGMRVHDVALDIVDLMNVMNGVGPAARAEWQLDERSDPDSAPSVDGRRAPLTLVHAPTRSTFVPPPAESSGRPLTSAGSVHLHCDDTEDCGYPPIWDLKVPPDADSGLYALVLTDGGETHELPFVVEGRAEVMLLVPTLTWQAYANLGRDASWPGLSHYSLHSDGSPVTMTTSRRPTQTFAPDARLEVDAGDGFATGQNAAHLMLADLYAWYWLRQEFPGRVAAMDDRALHAGADDVLAGVRVLVLSAHPEYWTAAMLDRLDAYLAGGGSVIYLGGNGLYWVTSLHPAKPHLMEIRRWGGSQTWSIEELDRLHQFEPCLGGLWEDAGRPPNLTVGIGFGGFGNGPSLEFTRTLESHAPRWSWAFDGVDGETFGADGLNGGAGNEFDLYDPARTPPGESMVIARSVPQGPDHFGTFELQGHRAPTEAVRGDIVLTATPAGGWVLAVGSITASGCLTSGRSPGLPRLVGNVVRRALSDEKGQADDATS